MRVREGRTAMEPDSEAPGWRAAWQIRVLCPSPTAPPPAHQDAALGIAPLARLNSVREQSGKRLESWRKDPAQALLATLGPPTQAEDGRSPGPRGVFTTCVNQLVTMEATRGRQRRQSALSHQ